MNSVDILTTSPYYCYKKCMETTKENCYFDIGDLRVNAHYEVYYTSILLTYKIY